MDFYQEGTISSVRKARPCGVCNITINAGEPATKFAGRIDGDFVAETFHPDCREAEVAFNRETLDGEWYSLRYDRCSQGDDTWIVKDFPAVAQRLGISTNS